MPLILFIVLLWLVFAGGGYYGGWHSNAPGLYLGGNGFLLVLLIIVAFMILR